MKSAVNDKLDERLVIAFLFSQCGGIHQVAVSIKDTNHNGLVMNLEEDNRLFYMCLAALYVDSRKNGGAKLSIESSFMGTVFFLVGCSVHSAEMPGKNTCVRSKLPTVACWSREKREEGL